MKRYLIFTAFLLIICTALTGCGMILLPGITVSTNSEIEIVESVVFLGADSSEAESVADMVTDESGIQVGDGDETCTEKQDNDAVVDSGLTLIEVTHQNVYQYEKYDIEDTGVIIIESLNTSELKCGDKVTHINGEEVGCADDVEMIIGDCKVGDVVTVTVERGGQTMNVELTLSEKTPDSVNFG